MKAGALLFAALLGVGQSPPPPSPQVPYRVEIVPGEQSVDTTYDPARDQAHLTKPRSWCARPAAGEPLLREAREIAADEDDIHILRLNQIKPVPVSSVRVVPDETVCERAAKIFDAEWFGQGNADTETHTTFEPVLVVAVGPLYLVGIVRKATDCCFVVLVFDHDFNDASGNYGRGL